MASVKCHYSTTADKAKYYVMLGFFEHFHGKIFLLFLADSAENPDATNYMVYTFNSMHRDKENQ